MNNKLPIAAALVVAVLAGAGGMWFYQSRYVLAPIMPPIMPSIITPNLAPAPFRFDDQFLNNLFDDSFFEQSRSPFREMDRIRSRMKEMFERDADFGGFDDWFESRYGSLPVNRIVMNEDATHVYYDLSLEGQDVSKIDVKTADGMVSIDAELSTTKDGMSSTTSLNQRFPIPPNVNADSVKVSQESGSIRISFEKLK